MKKTLLVLLFTVSSAISNTYAKDYGVQGATYPVVEKDFVQEIQSRLKVMEKNGQLAKFQNDVKKQMVNGVNRPKAIAGITKTPEAKSWVFDPSVSVKHDLADQNGRVFYRAGSSVNPLDHISLTKTLLFIDGDDKDQINWALKQDKIKKGKTKIILVKGAIIELMKEKKVRFYFDQNGVLTQKFQIKHVPAKVEQEGKKLRISEVLI